MTEKSIKSALKRSILPVFKIMARSQKMRDRVIVRMDGGICSQMHFYMVGDAMRRRGCRVGYDLKWFSEVGRDIDGRFVRNFDLLKAFPDLDFEEAGAMESRVLRWTSERRNDWFGNEGWKEAETPVYMSGYYREPEEFFSEAFGRLFHIDEGVLGTRSREVLARIRDAGPRAVAIHVRRGDLAREIAAYGKPATEGYFAAAVKKVTDVCRDARFFVFSDEPEWCRTELLPRLPQGDKMEVVDVNGSDRGYEDLILISRCRHIVTSKGSLGRYAAMLREGADREGIVTVCSDGPGDTEAAAWARRFPSGKLIGR